MFFGGVGGGPRELTEEGGPLCVLCVSLGELWVNWVEVLMGILPCNRTGVTLRMCIGVRGLLKCNVRDELFA
jgi:hypothetical protein